MPNILFNMPSQYARRPSGVARMALELLDNLIGKGDFHYTLRSPWTRADLPESLRQKELSVVTIKRADSRGLDVLWQSITFPMMCRRENIDLVVNLDPFGSASGGRARMVIVHDIYFRTIAKHIEQRAVRTNDLILKLMLFGNNKIVTVSEATKTDLELWYPQAKGRVTAIHSATSIKPVALSNHAREVSGRYVLAVGNATENKNFGALAQAMAKINLSIPDVALVHVGDDENEIIAATLKSLGSSLRLLRLKGIDDERLATLYADASCLCVPSFYEGFCLPVLEAQVCGCPVVCSNKSATPEIAGDGALLFDPSDAAELAECLRSVLTDEAASERLRALGYRNAERFSWALAAAQYQKVFEELLGGRR